MMVSFQRDLRGFEEEQYAELRRMLGTFTGLLGGAQMDMVRRSFRDIIGIGHS